MKKLLKLWIIFIIAVNSYAYEIIEITRGYKIWDVFITDYNIGYEQCKCFENMADLFFYSKKDGSFSMEINNVYEKSYSVFSHYLFYSKKNSEGIYQIYKKHLLDNKTELFISSPNDLLYPSVSENAITYIEITNYDSFTRNKNYKVWKKSNDGKILIDEKKDIFSIPNYQSTDNLTVWTEIDRDTYLKVIYLWDGKHKIQLTSKSESNRNPKAYNNLVVWEHFDGNDWEIEYWDGKSRHLLTNNDVDDNEPAVFENRIAWVSVSQNSKEIMYWNGKNIHKITDNDLDDVQPYIYNGYLAWLTKLEGMTSAVKYIQVENPWLNTPTRENIYTYEYIGEPYINDFAKYSKPVGLGNIENGFLTLKIETHNFKEPMDIYLALQVPEYSSEVFLFKNEGGLQPLSKGIVAWKTNVKDSIKKTIVHNVNIRDFPKGHYNFYLLAVPKGATNLEKSYLWITNFLNE